MKFYSVIILLSLAILTGCKSPSNDHGHGIQLQTGSTKRTYLVKGASAGIKITEDYGAIAKIADDTFIVHQDHIILDDNSKVNIDPEVKHILFDKTSASLKIVADEKQVYP